MKLEIELSEAEAKAVAYITDDPQFFVSNMVHEAARKAMDLIVEEEVRRMLADPETKEIPADREAIVLNAKIKSMAERAAETPIPLVDDGV
jgi:hypothetical protein